MIILYNIIKQYHNTKLWKDATCDPSPILSFHSLLSLINLEEMFPTHGNNQINWASTDYKLPLATSFHGTPNVDTPLAEVFNGTVKSGYGKFFMPPSFDNNDEEKCRQTLFPLLHRIAGDCGFTVTCRFRKTAKVVRAILVGCSRSEKYQLPPENKKNPRNCYTARPLKSEHQCNFHFFCRILCSWYLLQRQLVSLPLQTQPGHSDNVRTRLYYMIL